MTPGQQALAEAARLEAARVYSRVVKEHRQRDRIDTIDQAISAGWTNAQIMNTFHCGYDKVRAARKAAMRGAA